MVKCCEICMHVKARNKLFRKRKYICSMHNYEISVSDVCPQFVQDGNKVLQYAGFRHHEFGSKDACDSCAHRESIQGETGVTYCCKKNNVRFWSGFSPTDYICNNFEDGGLDALSDYMADLFIEQNRFKKGGK